MSIGTHVIVGFPGETEKDFKDTLQLVSTVDYDFLSCFSHSENSGASSANLGKKVNRQEKHERISRVKDLLGDRVTSY